MKHTHIESEFEIVIEKRPVIYYMISVINGYDGVRRVNTVPVSMIPDDECDPFDAEELVDGETVINTIPAQPGHFEIGYWGKEGRWEMVGYEIPGIPSEDWASRTRE